MPINVVYIDDEEALCCIFKEYLHSDEINITVFTDEQPAIEYCNNTKPDMIFIDYRLQKQTGDDVANALSCIAKKILVTGELDVTLNTCFDDIIAKPFKLADIKAYIIANNSN